MVKVLDMKFIRYANLFGRVTRIRTNHCFMYNNTIVFAVPRKFVPMAIGVDNSNLKQLNQLTGKRIKIVAIPNGREDIENFVSVITYPTKFRAIEIRDNDAIINADPQSKASLIGRGKIRLEEMENILGQYFGIKKVMIR
jgi:transcription antitermination factor NusA-like protein